MKARVKATGDIIEISEDCSYLYAEHYDKSYNLDQLEFLDVKEKSFPKDEDYWTRLEHQAAIAAMQGMIIHYGALDECGDLSILASSCVNLAHVLVEKYKKEERK